MIVFIIHLYGEKYECRWFLQKWYLIAVLLRFLENVLLGVTLENAKGFLWSFACHKDFNRNLNYAKANDVEKLSFLMNMEKWYPRTMNIISSMFRVHLDIITFCMFFHDYNNCAPYLWYVHYVSLVIGHFINQRCNFNSWSTIKQKTY